MPLRTSLYRKPSSGRWSSRNFKRREVLSVNMISLPLADFRHISHIGNDAHKDSFGDLSFLKMGHSLLLRSSQSEQNLFLASPPPPKPPRLNLAEGSDSPDLHIGHVHNTSHRRKKCSSMPMLDSEEKEAEIEEEDGYQRVNNVAPNLAPSLGRGSLNSDKDEDSTETCDKTVGQHREEDSGFSFSFDLGPSILDDVLRVMDKHHN
ncbi:cdc42 effector protein 3 [Etheostoma cragini]|uniref:cdc42 effector protein 3 n=1 Tax=Etheostoma cragini TaxID=417921 RepID=UPI00155F2BA5|nr:cdc42 effector protein 3 [Etheostoma cragini]XP_034713646.1 cdc42 effector protein 3 [Etheostoma cragini]XP_034713647.1 cdc42 effector protein 3 [Etheostoma cragini]